MGGSSMAAAAIPKIFIRNVSSAIGKLHRHNSASEWRVRQRPVQQTVLILENLVILARFNLNVLTNSSE
ncbi:MAG: hypothetical protein VCA36_08325 [Opitutales bacterium]